MKDRIGQSSKKPKPSASMNTPPVRTIEKPKPSPPDGGGNNKKIAIILIIAIIVALIGGAIFFMKDKVAPAPEVPAQPEEILPPSEEVLKQQQDAKNEHDLLMKTKALPVPSYKAMQDTVLIRELVGEVKTADNGVNPRMTAALEPESLAEKAAEFKANTNDDNVGWVKISNTNVDYPVVYKAGIENYDYYNALGYDKKYSHDGVIWADYECTFPNIPQNITLYGHNWSNVRPPFRSQANAKAADTMFAQVHAFANPEFAQQNPFVQFSTTEKDYVWQIFATFYTDLQFTYSFANMEQKAFQKTIAEAKAKSVTDYGVNVTSDDNILTLSTCTRMMNAASGDENQRFIVMAKLVREGTPSTTISTITNPMNYKKSVTVK